MTPLRILSLAAAALTLSACSSSKPPDGKIHLAYWEKWSGLEEYAMQRVVDEFNRSQDRIVVDLLSVGQVERKTMLATAGGDPPDIAGIYLSNVASFADRNALIPLDSFIREDGTTPTEFLSRYAPGFSEIGSYQGKIWGVPSTPTTFALYWNKEVFREVGLDPEKPPRTLAEMDEMSRRLTVHDAQGNLKHVGFLPQVTSWLVWAYPQWFGGQIFDGTNVTVSTNPQNLETFRWLERNSDMYGKRGLRRMSSTFGSNASPQDPFMTGQVAMCVDGVWRSHFVRKYAPGLDYGVTSLPSATPGVSDFTVADSDMLVIPAGAKHPHEAWEFLKYIASPNLNAQKLEELRGTELLCYWQEKASPMKQWSPFFEQHNLNQDIAVFRRLDESPHAIHLPGIGIWEEYQREMVTAYDKIRLGIATPEEALAETQDRLASSWKWHRESLERRQKAP